MTPDLEDRTKKTLPEAPGPLPDPWARPPGEVLERLETDPEEGLPPGEAESRRGRYGPNLLREMERPGAPAVFVRQFKSLIIGILAVAGAVSLGFGEEVEAAAIFAAIVINTVIGFVTELRAVRSMEALRRLGSVTTRVIRGGEALRVPAEELVPGDVVFLEGGDMVTADLRLVVASRLEADESVLTGESVPVAKSSEAVDSSAPLAERSSMLFKGTAVTGGSGSAVVTSTGMATELGRISELAEEATDEVTPLERRLGRLGRNLVWVTLGLVGIVAVAGIVAGRDILLMIKTSTALAVAAIPEGLPIVATVALARGMWRMARRNAVINRLSSVETLGSTNVIFTDKTGTLTENRMRVSLIIDEDREIETEVKGGDWSFIAGDRIDPASDRILGEILRVAVLCNNASLGDGEGEAVGDPLEVALLEAAAGAGIGRRELVEEMPEVEEEAFHAETKMMATFHRGPEGIVEAVKGAPEHVLEASSSVRTRDGVRPLDDEGRRRWMERVESLAARGLRTLAVARRDAAGMPERPYRDLTLLGAVGMFDPPREDVSRALELCREAGIKVVMVTGDQAVTAVKIGSELGLAGPDTEALQGDVIKDPGSLAPGERQKLLGASIFARVTPEEKLNLVGMYQEEGWITAMTGDGVNDAPALKKADIGVAMGLRGTDVARQAADMVLKDDAFSTIVSAVREGRVIFGNIRKFVVYLLSGNTSEILAVTLASLAGAPLPLLPLQILFINMVIDVFPALALGVGEGSPHVMERPPRAPDEPVLTGGRWGAIAGYGVLIAGVVLLSLWLALNRLGMNTGRAVSVSFLTLGFSRLWHVFNMRDRDSGTLRNDVTRNPYVWAAVGLCAALFMAAAYMPGLSGILEVEGPGPEGWLLLLGLSLVPLAAGQTFLVLRSWRRKAAGKSPEDDNR
jgi:Ca2+-transporting ATPase